MHALKLWVNCKSKILIKDKKVRDNIKERLPDLVEVSSEKRIKKIKISKDRDTVIIRLLRKVKILGLSAKKRIKEIFQEKANLKYSLITIMQQIILRS